MNQHKQFAVNTRAGYVPEESDATNVDWTTIRAVEGDNSSCAAEAVLIHAGVAFARAVTAACNGAVVCYGWQTINDGKAIHEVGTAKVSRARKYLQNRELMASLEDKTAFVNFGGGKPI